MAAVTDWSEVMSLEETMAQKERIVKGDNEWSGDNMWEKSDRAGCRVITTNAAKRVLCDKSSTCLLSTRPSSTR